MADVLKEHSISEIDKKLHYTEHEIPVDNGEWIFLSSSCKYNAVKDPGNGTGG